MSSLTVSEVQGQLVVDSRLIADELGIEHRGLMQTIKKYLDRLERKDPVTFEMEVVKRPQGGTYEVSYCYLNERQATLLMTFSRNTEQVLSCKERLVDAFDKAKQIIKEVIPAQNDHIRELELQNEVLSKQLSLRQLDHTMLVMHGKETVLALRGMADQIVETEKPTIEVIDERHNVALKGQTLVQVKEYVEKRFGLKFKSGAEVKRFLERKGEGHLIAQTPRSILADYVPEENLASVYRLLQEGKRQMLLGES